MDDVVRRPRLVENINSAFSAENIAITVARLAGRSRRGDFLTISRILGLLGNMDDAMFRRYRRRVNSVIPLPIQQILTTVHRAALYTSPPIPMHMEINPRTPPSIQVTRTTELISVILNRPDPQPFKE